MISTQNRRRVVCCQLTPCICYILLGCWSVLLGIFLGNDSAMVCDNLHTSDTPTGQACKLVLVSVSDSQVFLYVSGNLHTSTAWSK